jgi:hypothetical protein
MFRRKAERLPDRHADENRPALSGRPPRRAAAAQAAKKRDRRSDLTVAALGITLGLICALFPWYIFFNPDEFGVRAMRFGGGGNGTTPIVLGAQTDRVGAPAAMGDNPPVELDLLSTGSAVKEHEETEEQEGETSLAEQPFPPPVIAFRVVQIANGRAMLEDDTGLFVVQPGSILPDSSRVATIEERAGRPVLVTDAGVVLGIEE